MSTKNKVIIVTGPCGVGKTTVVNILAKKIKAELIDGEKIKQTLFPDVYYITEYPEKLKMVKDFIFELSKKKFSNNKSILIDYVIIGKEYISLFQNTFKENLIFKVILPNKSIIYQRDQNRECWTSGKQIIDELHDKYLCLIDLIGQDNFIDNENETPEETAQSILNCINKR